MTLKQMGVVGLLGVAALLAGMPTVDAARFKRPDTSLFDPAFDAGRFMSVHDSETFLRGRWSTGVYLDYARRPLELRELTTNRKFPIVRDVLTGHFTGGFGITDWMSVGADVPVIFWQVFFDPDQQLGVGGGTLGGAPKQTRAGLGDIRLETKFRLLDIDRYNFGIALVPQFIFPTGRRGSFISGERWTPGAKAVFEGNIKDRVWLGVNVGYQYVRNSNQFTSANPNAVIDDTFTVGVGGRVRITDAWAFIGEVLTEGVLNNLYKHSTQTPMEVLGGIQFTPQSGAARGLGVTLMTGGGITRGVGAPQVEVALGLTYPTPKIVNVKAPRIQVDEKIIITQKIHFAFDSARIRPISFPILDDVAQILRENSHLAHVRVEGHTDSIGSDAYNMGLSRRRAGSVVNYLVQAGISRHRLAPEGFGEGQPIAENSTDEGRAKNRRTEFTITN
jgi:OmpA-OmpF porin, OOP family